MAVIVLIILFVGSSIAIIGGYYNMNLGLDLLPISWVFEEIPVLKAAAFNTLLAPVNLAAAFITSRGSYEMYRAGIAAYSLTTPYLVVFAFLPGATGISDHLQLNFMPMILLLVALQVGACYLLKDRTWKYGGRDGRT